MKEEYICGTFGIEARYPFLDKQVVQEFLSLSHHIKNSQYKSSILNYLKLNNYPFIKDIKTGFSLY